MIRFFFIYSAIVLMLACDRADRNVFYRDDIGISDTLYCKENEIPLDMLMPKRIMIVDGYLIVFDSSGQNLFNVFKLPALKYLYSFGNKGNGPDEFVNIDPNTIKAFGGNLVFLDNNKLVTMRIEDDRAIVLDTDHLAIGRNPLNRLQLINDSTYVVDMMEGEYEYSFVNIHTNAEIKKFGIYPSEGQVVSSSAERYQKFLKSSVLSPLNNKLAMFYTYHNKIRFYEDGDFLLEVNINGEHDSDYFSDNQNPVIFRVEPYATTTNIYVLNIGKKKKDIDFSVFQPKIEKWNWDGDLIDKYLLNKSVISFCISEEYGKIYATTLESTNKIYTFDLPITEEKKNQTELTYKQIDNDFYVVDVPNMLDYAVASPRTEKNKITEHNGFLYNSSYFTVPISDKGDADFKGSVGIVVATGHDDFTLEDFTLHRDKDIKEQCHTYNTSNVTIANKKVIISDCEYEGVDPDGKPFKLMSRKWRWKEQAKFVEIDYSSTEDFELYIKAIQPILNSFSIKPT